jgi:hypothetical protein
MKSRIKGYLDFLLELKRFLNSPISFEDAKAIVERRMELREENFLRFVKGSVFDYSSSPYLPLFDDARCSYGDLVSVVGARGLEGALKLLKEAGVRVSFDEFKGRGTLRRGGREYRVSHADFDNPLLSPGLEITTGGSSGRPIRSHMYLNYLAARACYDQLMFKMLDIYDLPLALWYPKLPAPTGLGNCLRYAKIGHPPGKWFNMLSDSRVRPGWELRLANSAVVYLSRFSKAPLPGPEPLGLEHAGGVVDWITSERKSNHGCVVQSYVSMVLRICQAAAQKGADLEGTQFMVGSEPLTEAKKREVEKVNARVFPRYHSAEMGSIATGCPNPSEAGEAHLLADTVAMLEGEASAEEPERVPFFFTSFIDYVPKVMINVDLGDTGIVVSRGCGCLLEEMGFNTHLLRVRSFSRATSEGMAACYRELSRISEEVLPSRYGGSSIDYQWVEAEDERGQTRLLLRVGPGVGPVKEGDMVSDVFYELGRVDTAHRIYAQVWRQAGTIRVLRERPGLTPLGKHTPVVYERKA